MVYPVLVSLFVFLPRYVDVFPRGEIGLRSSIVWQFVTDYARFRPRQPEKKNSYATCVEKRERRTIVPSAEY